MIVPLPKKYFRKAAHMIRYSILREPLLLFLVGACLSISQFVMIRDFITILYGEEVVIILVTAASFMGLSIGYFLSLKFYDKFFTILLTSADQGLLTYTQLFGYPNLSQTFRLNNLCFSKLYNNFLWAKPFPIHK